MSLKIKILLLVTALLLGLAGYLYVKGSQKDTFASSSRDFAVEDVDRIGRIFAVDREGNSYNLERKSDTWYVDGYEADKEFVGILLTTLQKMTVKNLVPKTAISKVMKDIATMGKKVEVYDKSGRVMKIFYIGTGNQVDDGTFMVLDGSNIPYEVGLPAFPGNIAARFWPFKFIDMRSRVIAEYKAGEIKSIVMEYPRNKSESFILNVSGPGKYDIHPYYDITTPINRPIKNGEVDAFLSGFEMLISGSVYSSNLLNQDTLVSDIPFLNMKITDTKDNEKTMIFYPFIPLSARSEAILLNTLPQHFFIVVNDKAYYTGQREVLQKIFFGYSYFYP